MKFVDVESRHSRAGVALIIVLAFVVLLAGLVVAFLSRSTTDRQLAQATYNGVKADQLARAGLDIIVADFKQEIINGSQSPPPIPGATLYVPSVAANLVPVRHGTPSASQSPIPNLVRRSLRDDALGSNAVPTPGLSSRASGLTSAPSPSTRGDVSVARWNRHYLIPKINTGNSATDPISSFSAPDWVLVTRNGPRPIANWDDALRNPTNPDFIIGRYAYAVYDESGLIDANVAGYPSTSTIFQSGRKGSLAFADLTQLDGFNTGQNMDTLVGWRNYATTQPSGDLNGGFTFPPNAANSYFSYVLANTGGNLETSRTVVNGLTDQSFASRQQLIAFSRATAGGIFGVNGLQYLTHFTREAEANSPQWSPPTASTTNPNFQTLRVTGEFDRSDGSRAKVGEPLVKTRFLLQRLNWLTYRGPSADRTIPTSAPAIGNSDYDMWLLTTRFGLSADFLNQGTAANIQRYFGLSWNTANERWDYTGPVAGALANSLATLDTLTGSREANFFELLQAAIDDSSLGLTQAAEPSLPTVHQTSKMLQLLTIGANMVAQTRCDSFPIRIAFRFNSADMEAIGTPRLPYLNSLAVCPVAGTGTGGGLNWFLVPNLWDPYRDNWDLIEANVSDSLTPAYLRPQVRIMLAGSVDFGTVAGSTPSQSGVVTTGVTILSSLTVASSTIVLRTANAGGRDGLGEASRMSTSDCATAPATYTATTSPPSASAGWCSVSRPPRSDGTSPGSGNFVVYRFSLPGSSIPVSTTTPTQNPTLTLRSGFQINLEYQSPNGAWYPYSFLQGNNVASSTGIINNLHLKAGASFYGFNPAPTPAPPATAPTVLSSGNAATPWTMVTVSQAPMFAKADPRSIRYNSQVGMIDLPGSTVTPTATPSAAIFGSIWPRGYSAPPLMSTMTSPGPAPNPNPNPAGFSLTESDNRVAGSNPYNESTSDSASVRPIIMNRPFRSVGELGYVFRDQPFKTLDFSSSNSPDSGLLDIFSVNEIRNASGVRAGTLNLNSRQALALAAMLSKTIRREDTPRELSSSASPSPQPSPLTAAPATSIAASLVTTTTTSPVINKASLPNIIASETALGPSTQKTQRDAIVRALADVGQTRTWNLLIDVIAQAGRYPPNATDFSRFIMEGERRYWLHVAIDRFTGEIIDQQLEAVYE